MNHFNKEKDEQLIKAVKAKPVLYRPHHPQHRNCIVKYHAWEDISKTLDVPIPAIKKRWKHLRDHYKKKMKQTKNNGSNKWEYMSLLGFLNDKGVMDVEMSSGVEDDRTDNEDIVIKIEEYSGSEHSNPIDSVNVNVEEKNKDPDAVSITIETNEDDNKEDDVNKNNDARDDVVEKTELKRNFEALNLASINPVSNENNIKEKLGKRIEKMKEIRQILKNKRNTRKLNRNSEVPITTKKRKYKDDEDEEADEIIGGHDDGETEEVSNVLYVVRRRLESILTDIDKCEESAKRSGIKANAADTPIHRFFEAVADIVVLLPPHFIAEARLKTCIKINELEKQCLQKYESL